MIVVTALPRNLSAVLVCPPSSLPLEERGRRGGPFLEFQKTAVGVEVAEGERESIAAPGTTDAVAAAAAAAADPIKQAG